MKTRVCLAGATGFVGRSLVRGILETEDLELVGAVSRTYQSQHLGTVLGCPQIDLTISGSVQEALKTRTDVLIDYTHPSVVKSHVLQAVNHGVHVVVGTSGLTESDYAEIDAASRDHRVGVILGGNFALTAVLMQRFALVAAKYIPQWEIIDDADAKKIDSPSGSARELAYRLSHVRKPEVAYSIEETIGQKESRGATVKGSQVHSIRLQGCGFSMEIRFGMPNERLVLRHEAGNSAEPYVYGTLLSARKVGSFIGLVKGWEEILEL